MPIDLDEFDLSQKWDVVVEIVDRGAGAGRSG